MKPLIRMTGIEKRFPGVHALRSVQFDLRAGEVHALMGENGAGKSTLMKILSGVYKRDRGMIELDGHEVSFPNPRAAQDAGIGIIHQELSLMNDLSIAQNIFIGREPRKYGFMIDDAKMNRDAAVVFAQMNVALDPAQLVHGLSIAKQQMVEIAKALSYDSRVLIMDEPTAALNAREIDELFRIIDGLRAAGKGIVYISHKMDEIRRISNRVTIMRDGEWIGTRDTAEVSLEQIIAMMVGRELAQGELNIPDLSGAEVALEVRGLSRGRAVRDVSFTLKRGEILGFAGLMGAGRTEVARAIFGADPLEAGEILVHGRVVNVRSPVDAVRAGVGYLSEDRKHLGLALPMSVRDNIALTAFDKFRRFGGMLDEGAMAQVARAYITKLDIRTPSDQQEVRLLSGGNQQKIVIAKWLLRDCDVLIFDEPTRGIDVGAKSEIYRLLNELAAEGRAIIVISSELQEILRLSHRIAVMCEGRLTGFLPGGTASQEQIMALATQAGPKVYQEQA